MCLSDRRSAQRENGLLQATSYEILQGDVRSLIPQLPQAHCVATSPPYFGQRTYGDNPNREIGRETDVDSYIGNLVAVFTAIDLHPEGSIWVNLADKRSKDATLMCIPEQFVVAMAQAGFGLVDRAIWAKSEALEDGSTTGNYAPEPCRNRLNDKAHEPFYKFTKSRNAWTDTLAVQLRRHNVDVVRYLPEDLMTVETALNGRNLHAVWNIRPGQTSEKHYAVFPPALCERPIAMTCPLMVNPDGSLPRRIVEMVQYDEGRGRRRVGRGGQTERTGRRDGGRAYVPTMPVSRGWEPIQNGAAPGVVLDPFSGTGTAGEVALKLGRSFIGVDLYPDYVEIATRRCAAAFEYVETHYGYDRVYEMITTDQGDPRAAGNEPAGYLD